MPPAPMNHVKYLRAGPAEMPSPKKETMKEKVYMCSGASDRYSEHSKREYYEPLMGVIIHVL